MPLPSWNPHNIDLALMPFDEFLDIVDKDRKSHPNSAYQTTVDGLSQYIKSEKYPRIIRQVTVRGLLFTVRMREEKNQYARRDDQGEYIRGADNKIVYHSDEEIAQMDLQTHEYSVAIFDEDGHAVASFQDEWGCALIMVAKEYRGFGFGHMLFGMWAKLNPAKPSGGFSPSGYQSARKMHREIVRSALASGRYSKLVRAGDITMERVQEILQSVDLSKRLSKPSELSLRNDNPKDWLFYIGEGGDFIVYDRKLRALLEENEDSIWVDKMILGMIYVVIDGGGFGRIKVFDAETPKLKALLMAMAVQYTVGEGDQLVVEPDDVQFLPAGTPIETVNKARGYDSVTVRDMVMRPLDLKPFAAVEKHFRKDDRYDEFLHSMIERAYSKFS